MYESQISFMLDTICPWTYLAKKRLDKALLQIQGIPEITSKAHFTVKFLPYELYPTNPSGVGVDKWAWHRDQKYGGDEERMKMWATMMEKYGELEDIPFKFTGIIARTVEAHRVVQHFQETKGPEKANKLINALYRMYFEEEKHPSSPETLLAACAEAGIDEEEARKVVEDEDLGLAEVKAAIRESGMNGPDGVPQIMVEGKKRDITLVGLKEVAEYVKTLQMIAKEAS